VSPVPTHVLERSFAKLLANARHARRVEAVVKAPELVHSLRDHGLDVLLLADVDGGELNLRVRVRLEEAMRTLRTPASNSA
jgi:hypothetical protein